MTIKHLNDVCEVAYLALNSQDPRATKSYQDDTVLKVIIYMAVFNEITPEVLHIQYVRSDIIISCSKHILPGAKHFSHPHPYRRTLLGAAPSFHL